jgi:hypothetical protein
MRTGLLDVLRFAWRLYRHPHRDHCRIGQIIVNSTGAADIFYWENRTLTDSLRVSDTSSAAHLKVRNSTQEGDL